VLPAANRSLVFGRGLVGFESPVGGVGLERLFERRALTPGHRHEPTCNLQVLTQHLERVDTRHSGADRQAHGVTERLSHPFCARLDGATVAPQALHTNRRDPAPRELGQHAGLKTSKVPVEAVERELTRVERIVERQHAEMDLRILVSGETDKSRLALRPGPVERLDDAVPGEVPIGVVVIGTLVDLPQVEMVRAQPPQRLLELFLSSAASAAAFAREVRTPLLDGRATGVAADLLTALIDAIGGTGRAIAVPTQHSRSTNNTVTRALEYVRGQKWGGLQVTDMADAAEVTSRTLLRVFRQQLDLGPASYLKLRQLNIVRRELRGKHAPVRKITDIMGEQGVTEFGRFASEYRALFRERPSDTLARSRLELERDGFQVERPRRSLRG